MDQQRPAGEGGALRQIARLHGATYQTVAYDKGMPQYTVRCTECGSPAPCPTLIATRAVGPTFGADGIARSVARFERDARQAGEDAAEAFARIVKQVKPEGGGE